MLEMALITGLNMLFALHFFIDKRQILARRFVYGCCVLGIASCVAGMNALGAAFLVTGVGASIAARAGFVRWRRDRPADGQQ